MNSDIGEIWIFPELRKVEAQGMEAQDVARRYLLDSGSVDCLGLQLYLDSLLVAVGGPLVHRDYTGGAWIYRFILDAPVVPRQSLADEILGVLSDGGRRSLTVLCMELPGYSPGEILEEVEELVDFNLVFAQLNGDSWEYGLCFVEQKHA